MDLIENAENFCGVEGLCVHFHQRVPHGRRAFNDNVVSQRLFPLHDLGLKVVAVTAAVPEEFGDFDLVGLRTANRW